MDKLQAMRVVIEIAERGSLTNAAISLDKSLPTVVRVLADLEAGLGVRLFNRTTRRIALTPEGQTYLERARQIIEDIAETEDLMSARQIEPAGKIRITAPVLFGQMHVMPSVTRFLQRFPSIEIELVLLDRSVDLIHEGFDLGIRIAHLADSTMVCIPVGEIRSVVCASSALLKKTKLPRHPRTLQDHPCVLFTGLAQGNAWRFSDNGREFRVLVNGPFACNHAQAALSAAISGVGFAQFLSYQIAPAVAAKELKIVLHKFQPPSIPVNVVFPHARLMSMRTRSFVDWIKKDLSAALR